LKALGLTFLLQLHERTDEVMGQEWLMTVFVDKERSGNARPMTSQSRVAQFSLHEKNGRRLRQNSVLGHSCAGIHPSIGPRPVSATCRNKPTGAGAHSTIFDPTRT